MKKTLIIILLTGVVNSADAQTKQDNQMADYANSQRIAYKMARKISDTLNLTDEQQKKIYEINLKLHDYKQAARKQYSKRDVVAKALQRIEGTRDSLYRQVIISPEVIKVYSIKKKNLITNN